MMLHLHPNLVRMDQVKNFPNAAARIERDNTLLRAEGSVGFGWQTQDLNTEGACGDASRADAAKGATLVDRAARALATLIQEVARFPLASIGR
jgi:creatinine amidohydrolase